MHAMARAPNFFKVGLPFFAFMLGGYYGLSQFVTGKVERQDLQMKSQSKREFSLEEEREVRRRLLLVAATALRGHVDRLHQPRMSPFY